MRESIFKLNNEKIVLPSQPLNPSRLARLGERSYDL